MSLTKRDGDYLRDFRRRTAETRNAIVTASLGDGRYTIRLNDTGQTVNATALQGTTYAAGNPVIVRHDASGRMVGRQYQILGKLQDTSSGLYSTAYNVTSSQTAAAVTQWPSYPVELTAGGAGVEIEIHGVNLSGSATYGHASITDDVAQDVTATLATLTPKAAGGLAKGYYSLTFAGVTVPDFFVVV